MVQNRFPAGCDEERVAVGEDEAAFERPSQPVMKVPGELVPTVHELIAKHRE